MTPETSSTALIDAAFSKAFPGINLDDACRVLLADDGLTGADRYRGTDATEARADLTPEDAESIVALWSGRLRALLDEHGSIDAIPAWQRAEDERRYIEQGERNRIAAAAAIESAKQAQLDRETEGLLAAAEAILARGDDD